MNEKAAMPKWALETEESNSNLSHLLDFASENYGRHTDWFLKHKDTGIKTLAVILTAEITTISIYIANHLNNLITIFILIILSFLSFLLRNYAINSCRRSYRAALENALLITKTLWAMGLTKPIKVKSTDVDLNKCPVPEDETPYVPRYLNDAAKHKITQNFVDYHLSEPDTTCYDAIRTIRIFGGVVLLTGIMGLISLIVLMIRGYTLSFAI